jgi:lipoprotein-anchoring transpeptidase ErfK/SrfK
MSFCKWLLVISVVLFASIGAVALIQRKPSQATVSVKPSQAKVPVAKPQKAVVAAPAAKPTVRQLPQANRIDQVFSPRAAPLPFVETVTYSSRASWQQGKAAWIADYARHYATSTHLIARSLNGRADYEVPPVANGDRFNVLREGNWSFYLLVDVSRHTLWLYQLDHDKDTRLLIKSYPVGLGRLDPVATSKSLTPLGKYQLGQRTAIFTPGMQGTYRGQPTEMIRVFGTRWIPFEKEIAGCSAPAKGYGLHGAPWKPDPKTGKLVEERQSVGANDSDGCIRLRLEDIEELYALISTRPTTIEIVPDILTAQLPGREIDG